MESLFNAHTLRAVERARELAAAIRKILESGNPEIKGPIIEDGENHIRALEEIASQSSADFVGRVVAMSQVFIDAEGFKFYWEHQA